MESHDNVPAVVNGKGHNDEAAEGFEKPKLATTNGVVAPAAASSPSATAPLGPLLSYENSPQMESAFIATEARVYAASDAAFCLLYIIALCCSVWASSPSSLSSGSQSQPPTWRAFILAFTAMFPLVASITSLVGTSNSTSFYEKSRESLLFLLLLVPIVLGRRGSGVDRSSLDPSSIDPSSSPCLQRSAALTMALFMPLGCRIRFCWLLPAQMLNIASLIASMPWVQLQAAGCGATCAVVLACTGLLPSVLTYRCEVKARQRLATVLHTTPSTTTVTEEAR